MLDRRVGPSKTPFIASFNDSHDERSVTFHHFDNRPTVLIMPTWWSIKNIQTLYLTNEYNMQLVAIDSIMSEVRSQAAGYEIGFHVFETVHSHIMRSRDVVSACTLYSSCRTKPIRTWRPLSSQSDYDMGLSHEHDFKDEQRNCMLA